MKIDQQTKEDIELLLNVARDEIAAAEGNHHLFNDAGLKYGHIAHRVYMALDEPSKKPENYHNRSVQAVLLDPWTVTNRMRSFDTCDGTVNPGNPIVWNHADMIKTLIDYLALTYSKELAYASS